MKLLHPKACDFTVYKDYKIGPWNLFFQHVKSTWKSNTSPVLLSIIVSPSIMMFFWSPFQASFLNVSAINFWSYTFLSRTCFLRSSPKHAIQARLTAPKIVSLYFLMVSLMPSSSSSFLFIQFRRDMFNFFAKSTATSSSFIISFITPRKVTKIFCLLFAPQKFHHHHCSTCYIVSFLHQCIYTLQHIPEDDNFYLVSRQNRSLTLPLHCNTCRMEHLGHENLPLCVLSTFPTYHGCTCLLLLLVLSPVFHIAVTQPYSKSFYIEAPTSLPKKH